MLYQVDIRMNGDGIGAEEAPLVGLQHLPTTVIIHHVLPLLSADEVVRVAATCRTLQRTCSADAAWLHRCEARGWGPFAPGHAMAGFSAQRKLLCADCQLPTPYVFRLLNRRLCAACEHKSPRYALVTALEATQRYGVDQAELDRLPSHVSCDTVFYLRSKVMDVAAAYAHGPSRTPHAIVSEDASGSGTEDTKAEHSAARVQDSDSGSSSEAACGQEPRVGESNRHAERKAARKAAKKQAKLAQRARREAKLGTRERGHGEGSSSAKQSPDPSRGKPRSGRRGDKGRASVMQGSGRVVGAALLRGLYPDEEAEWKLRAGSPKQQSRWLQQREALMREWGEYGITGLVLG